MMNLFEGPRTVIIKVYVGQPFDRWLIDSRVRLEQTNCSPNTRSTILIVQLIEFGCPESGLQICRFALRTNTRIRSESDVHLCSSTSITVDECSRLLDNGIGEDVPGRPF